MAIQIQAVKMTKISLRYSIWYGCQHLYTPGVFLQYTAHQISSRRVLANINDAEIIDLTILGPTGVWLTAKFLLYGVPV